MRAPDFVYLPQEDPQWGSSPQHCAKSMKENQPMLYICDGFLPTSALIESPIYVAPYNSQAAKLFELSHKVKVILL